jgi:hypothetical protein
MTLLSSHPDTKKPPEGGFSANNDGARQSDQAAAPA